MGRKTDDDELGGVSGDVRVEPAPVLRRDLAAVLAAVGVAATRLDPTSARERDGEALRALAQAAASSAVPLRWVDTVLGLAGHGDLRQLNSFKLGDAVLVIARGAVAPGDGGGGVFYWESSPAPAGHDGGTLIVPIGPAPSGESPQQRLARSGRWVRVCDGPLNVRWFGATETGNADAAINAAIAAALAVANAANATAKGMGSSAGIALVRPELFWPTGAYKSAANIPNLHRVRHRGPGHVQRGSRAFYLDPDLAHQNVLHLAAAGASNDNDGLSPAEPLATIQAAFDALANYGPVLNGTWRIRVAAGTYRDSPSSKMSNATHSTPSRAAVIVEGPPVGASPNTPTAVFDGSNAPSGSWCFRCSGPGTQMQVRDLKLTGQTGYGGIGLLADRGCESFYIFNVHCTQMRGRAAEPVLPPGSGKASGGTGVYVENVRDFRSIGGLMRDCRVGIMLNVVSYAGLGYTSPPATATDAQYRASLAPARTHFQSCEKGVEWSRGTNGHTDYCRFDDCLTAIDVFHNARTHIMGCSFTRNKVAIRASTGGYYYVHQARRTNGSPSVDDATDPLLNDFHLSSPAQANDVVFQNAAYSGEADADLWLAQSERRVFSSLAKLDLAAAPAHLLTVEKYRISAGFFRDETKKLVVRLRGQLALAAGSLGFSLRFVPTDAPSAAERQVAEVSLRVTTALPADSVFECELSVSAAGDTRQGWGKLCGASGAPTLTFSASAGPMLAAHRIELWGSATAAQRLKAAQVEVYVTG